MEEKTVGDKDYTRSRAMKSSFRFRVRILKRLGAMLFCASITIVTVSSVVNAQESPATDFRHYLVVQGLQAANANPGFTRLIGSIKTEQHFVELNQLDIVPGLGKFPPGRPAQVEIKIESRFALSDYPSPASTNLPQTPIVRRDIKKIPTRPLGQYLASDGTVLTVYRDPATNQINGFFGKGKDGHTYQLWINFKTQLGNTLSPTVKASWIYAQMIITKDEKAPLEFGFGYCPLAGLFEIYLSGNTDPNPNDPDSVENMIQVSVARKSPLPSAQPIANLNRSFDYFSQEFIAQPTTMPYAATDPNIYLPAVATLWPFLDSLAFFAPALEDVSGVASALPALPNGIISPLDAFVSLAITFPVTIQSFESQMTAGIGSAFGPFAASFVSPDESQVASLKAAALWMGWALVEGSGKQEFTNELAAFYAEASANVGKYGGSSPGGPSNWQILKNLPPHPQVPPNKVGVRVPF
jgi:hypothetical protein